MGHDGMIRPVPGGGGGVIYCFYVKFENVADSPSTAKLFLIELWRSLNTE